MTGAATDAPRERAPAAQACTMRLGMLERPAPPPPAPDGLAVVECHDPPAWWFLALYDAVGGPNGWSAMHGEPAGAVDLWLADPAVRLFVAMRDGWPQGFFVVDARGGEMRDLTFFGLVPEAVGRGLGRWFLAEAVARAWEGDARFVGVTTASNDHPRALGTYLKAGFRLVDTEVTALPAPREPGPEPTAEHAPFTVTYLSMAERPEPAGPPPEGHRLVRSEAAPAWWFLALYDAVGSDYGWDDMHGVPRPELEARLADPAVALWWLERDGWARGFFLLDARGLDGREPGTCDLAYFGLVPQAVGRGLGRWFLGAALERAWSMPNSGPGSGPGTQRVTVNTCTLDHPRALPAYRAAGFDVLRREERPGSGPGSG